MITLEVNDMTCGHCVAAITRAVKANDADADVRIDLPSHRVEVESRKASAAQVLEAIRTAGYSPVEIARPDAVAIAGSVAARSGGCCGGGGAPA